jgi:predicted MFS family arabinose efflux permease
MRDFRPAQTAAGTAFLLSGVIFGSLVARLPALQSGLGLTDGELALALVALNGGAVAGLPAGAALCDRFGSRRTVRVVLPAFACLLPPIAVAPTMPALAFALAGSAATCSVLDVAGNANGVAVERRYGRVVLSRLHAMLTAGGMLGAGIGAAAASARVDVTTHFAAVAAVTAVGAIPLTRRLTADEPRSPGPAARSGRRRPARAGWPLRIGGLAFCVTLAEGSGNDWTAVYLHGLGGSGAFAAAGVAVFLGAMTAGRLAGDYLRHRVDAAPLVRGAACLAAAGLAAALLIRHPVAGLAGFGLFGLGLSITLPLILAEAGHRAAEQGQSPAATVARVSMMAYLGSFTGPALIGALATTTDLGTALFLPVAAVAVAVLGAGILAPRALQAPEPNHPSSSVTNRVG